MLNARLILILLLCSGIPSLSRKQSQESRRHSLLKTFVHWLESGGANLGKLKPLWLPGEGYTVVLSSDVQIGDVIAYVPDNLFIGPKAASKSNMFPLISHLPAPDQVLCTKRNSVYDGANVGDAFQTQLLLMQEAGNSSSFYTPYLKLLPGSFDSPLFWNKV
jgi:hypothetical protein